MSQIEYRAQKKQEAQDELNGLIMDWVLSMKVFDFNIEIVYEKSPEDKTEITAFIIKRINTENFDEEELANRIAYDYVEAVGGGKIKDIRLRIDECFYNPPKDE